MRSYCNAFQGIEADRDDLQCLACQEDFFPNILGNVPADKNAHRGKCRSRRTHKNRGDAGQSGLGAESSLQELGPAPSADIEMSELTQQIIRARPEEPKAGE